MEVSSSKPKKKSEEVPIAREGTPFVNEHGKRMRVEVELIDSKPESACTSSPFHQFLVNKHILFSR